jgi:hypothetical protein
MWTYLAHLGWNATQKWRRENDDEYPPFLGGIQFSLTNADN